MSGIAPLRAGLRSAAAPLRRSEAFGWKSRPVSGRVGGMSMDTESEALSEPGLRMKHSVKLLIGRLCSNVPLNDQATP